MPPRRRGISDDHDAGHANRSPAGVPGHPWQVIEIQALAPADWRAWRTCGLLRWPRRRLRSGPGWPTGRTRRRKRWRDRLAITGSVNFVALLKGKPAGMASGVPGEDAIPQLISMWVSPRGRGKGIGDRLVHEVAQWARSQGAPAPRLAVAEGNQHAAALYRRNGFTDTGELVGSPPDRIRILVKQLR